MIWRTRAEKREWIILRWWASENQTEKTPAMLRMGEKNSHNQKQLWEDGIKLEPWIFERVDQDFKRNLYLDLEMLRMTMRNTTMNCWDTPGEWKTKRLSQQWKIIWNRSWKTSDWWNSFLRQTSKRIWEWLREKLEESSKILGKDLWVRAHSKETSLKDCLK